MTFFIPGKFPFVGERRPSCLPTVEELQLWKNVSSRYKIFQTTFGVEHWNLMRPTVEKIELGIVESAQSILYPDISDGSTCTGMLLTNLAEPEWISINCDEKNSVEVFCTVEKAHDQLMIEKRANICPKNEILKEYCFSFKWHYSGYERHFRLLDTHYSNTTMCKYLRTETGDTVCSPNNIQILNFLFKAVSVKFPPVLLLADQTIISYKKYL